MNEGTKLDFNVINELNINDVFKIITGNAKSETGLNQLKDQFNKAKEDILRDLKIKYLKLEVVMIYYQV